MRAAIDPRKDDYRGRLLGGMVEAIAEVGYAEMTIADIVRQARVSKRTFYEHFATKEACFLALYETESERLLAEIERQLFAVAPGEARLRIGITVYLASLGRSPLLARTLLIEILHVGAAGLAVRRAVLRRFADLWVRELTTAGVALSPAVAMAIVGGINELLLEASEEDRLGSLGELADAIVTLVAGVASLSPPAPRASSPSRRGARSPR